MEVDPLLAVLKELLLLFLLFLLFVFLVCFFTLLPCPIYSFIDIYIIYINQALAPMPIKQLK